MAETDGFLRQPQPAPPHHQDDLSSFEGFSGSYTPAAGSRCCCESCRPRSAITACLFDFAARHAFALVSVIVCTSLGAPWGLVAANAQVLPSNFVAIFGFLVLGMAGTAGLCCCLALSFSGCCKDCGRVRMSVDRMGVMAGARMDGVHLWTFASTLLTNLLSPFVGFLCGFMATKGVYECATSMDACMSRAFPPTQIMKASAWVFAGGPGCWLGIVLFELAGKAAYACVCPEEG